MQKGRSAFEKRRRLAMVNDATQPSVAEPELQSIDFEIDGDGDLDKMWETVAVQTEPITSSKAIQTLKWKPKYFCQRRHFPKYSKPKIKSYKIRRTSRGVQCSLLSPKTRPKKRYRKASQSSVSSNKTDSDEEYRPECDTETESDDEFQEESLKFEEMKNEDDVDFQDQTKFIVYQSALLILFQFCSICKGENLVSKSVSSTCLTVRTQCKLCNHRTTWKSEPSIKGIPVTSILLSVGILLTGSLTAKVIRLFNFIKIQCLSTRTVYNHHSKYIHAAIRQVWERKRESMLDSLKSSPLLIGGDGRCDSPGHSACTAHTQ
ncbi:uncharacterized protein LOC141904248 [Tubulanus polymorphus]|uniref:uncharacterized protein LOC141904248 n=1 Tax=Tubulanus polymorphus TaxID=672921 RepID=UPI003DA59EF3